MSSDTNLVSGPYCVDAAGTMTLISHGDGVEVRADGSDSYVNLEATGNVSLGCAPAKLAVSSSGAVVLYGGPTGKVLQAAGAPLVGAQIELEPEAITMSVGPPGVGASLKMEATSITLQVGTTSFKMTLESIEETLMAVKRVASLTGHELTAAESSLKLDVTGLTTQCPLRKETVDATAQIQNTMRQSSFDAMKKEQAGLTMDN